MGRVKKSIIASMLLVSMLLSIFSIHLSAIAEVDFSPKAEQKEESTVTDEGYIKGSLKLVFDGAEISEMAIFEGEKEYVYTEFAGDGEKSLKYTWQILINEKSNSWATINDYLLSYAVISEALIKNQPNADGHATIRCIADDGENKYVSGNLEIIKMDAMQLFSGYSLYGARSTEENTEGEGIDTAPVGNDSGSSGSTSNAFNIVINYIFRHADNADINGKTASSPFTVTLPTSSSYTGTVTTPSVAGYTPYLLDDEHGTFEYGGHKYVYAGHYSFDKWSTDITVTICYIPNMVNYTVKYYEQNLYDDEYSYAGFEHKTAYADTVVPSDLDVERPGFTPLAYDDSDIISGDGEFAVEIYYDRNYCLVDVELGLGGHGVVPYYVRHDSQIILGTPTRMGYTFRGWELTKINDKPETELGAAELAAWDIYAVGNVAGTMITLNQPVAKKLLYTAKWEKAVTTYSVIYWVENADDNGYTLWGFKVYDATPGEVVSAKDDMEREDKSCFTFNEHLSDKNVTVEGDGTTAVNAYYTRNYYSLIFKNGSTCYVPEHTHGTDCVRPLICTNLTEHTHGTDCIPSDPICGYVEHTHDANCKNSCTIPVHEKHTDACLVCTIGPHTHTWECYNGATTETPGRNVTVSGNKQNGYVGRSGNRNNYKYWVYVEGTWYRYTGTVAYGSYVTPNTRVCPGDHVHSEENSCYKDSIHVHIEHCCNVPEHTHDVNACYEYSCELKQHSHENCYGECILYEHKHSGEGTTKIVKVIKKKYGADISKEWPIVVKDANGNTVKTYDEGQRWSPSGSDIYTQVLVYIPFMPPEDITFTVSAGGSEQYTMMYYLEALPGANSDKTFENKDYILNNTVKANYAYLTKAEDFFDITGFTQNKAQSKDGKTFGSNGQLDSNGGEVYLYYTRNEYELVYNNNGLVNDLKSHIFKYQQSIKDGYRVPDYPSNMEPGACYFDGWYYTPTCAVGTEVNFETDTMPAGDVVIYAKWSPMKYNVKVYMDNTKQNCILDETVYFNEMVIEPTLLNDGTKPGEMPSVIPSNYIFAGWYYMDGTVEKRFDFNTMMIKQNYEIYAKWTSTVPVNYVIYYRVMHADGTYQDIAEPERGQALVGITKSFTAKTGNKLNPGFTSGYYPEARSASLQMDIDETKNVYVFIYEHMETIKYSVTHNFTDDSTDPNSLYQILGVTTFSMTFYYELSNASDTSAEIVVSFRENVTEENVRNAIKAVRPDLSGEELEDTVDAAWERIKNASPDAYEKREILISNAHDHEHDDDHTGDDHTGDDHIDEQNNDEPSSASATTPSNSDNKITFNWSIKMSSYPCQVVHYTEDLDASPDGTNLYDDYTRYSVGEKTDYLQAGLSYKSNPIAIPGFTVNVEKSNCTKGADGKYYSEGVVTAPTLGNDEEGLILRFYYDREEYYYIVQHHIGTEMISVQKGPVRYGTTVTEYAKDVPDEIDKQKLESYYVDGENHQNLTVQSANQVITFRYSVHIISYRYQVAGIGDGGILKGELSLYNEDVDVNATPVGSIPTAMEGYVFAGWFTDAAGTIPVTESEANVGAAHNTIIPIPSASLAGKTKTFYAKFVPTHIVIQNNNVKDEKQTFIYRLRGTDDATEAIDITFAIVGNSSITISNLPIGNYVLTTNCDWAYRYSETEIAFTFNDNKIVWVDYHDAAEKWIGDNVYSELQ